MDDMGIFEDYAGPDNPTGTEWLHHLSLSPYCHRNCAVMHVNGRDVCQCGWHGPKVEPKVQTGMTFGELAASKGFKWDGHSFNKCEETSQCPQHRTPPTPADSCCSDPCVRGGMCVNCGEWLHDNDPTYRHEGGTTPQHDNEG